MVEQSTRQTGKLQRVRTSESTAICGDKKTQNVVEVITTVDGVISSGSVPKRQQSLSERKATPVATVDRAHACSCNDEENAFLPPQVLERASAGVPAAGRPPNTPAKTFSDHASKYTGGWITEKRNLIKQLETYKIYLENAQTHITHLESKNDRVETEREQMESDLRRLQKHVFQRFESPEWTPASNADIRRKLSQLDSEVKAWSKVNSILHLNVLNPKEHPILYKKLRSALQGFAKLGDEVDLMGVPDDKAWVLVQAFIMHNLYFDVFDHPFFGVSIEQTSKIEVKEINEEAEELSPKKLDVMNWKFGLHMQSFYYKLRTCNVQEAIAWRVQTLRQLHPSAQDGDPHLEAKHNMCRETLKNREKAVQSLASSYFGSGIRALLKHPNQEGVKDSLRSIMMRAADLSYSLWTQKIDLLPNSLKHLDEVFTHNHPLMDAHQLHSKHVDENPAHLDGMPILLITHPTLVRLGDDEGTDFGRKTVLKKAVCWMGQLPDGAGESYDEPAISTSFPT
ncbi:uncharacterized protein K460DRAFT_354703 [Cucurbitaria berberidis CBS 394.84]|uniref:Uncharacterized protein n=1 Tax=Cucurbitaria berberidis CBS 394.84 TaxID=1168544 RepID=A0A9P4GGH6_9PLEO|nr:uncharacterized protein K460DRAFT_354703 [Cucurbitaria berberidis CBS 394.84]KAF1844826.1 hypothetical protein K460DRAFT_354703 [Cucurbitaria berberidis CBS 394.84]